MWPLWVLFLSYMSFLIKNKPYMLHFTTYIPALRPILINWCTKVEHRNQYIHWNQTKQNNSLSTYCWTRCLVLPGSHSSIERCYLCLCTPSTGPFTFSTNPQIPNPFDMFSHSPSFISLFYFCSSIRLSLLFLFESFRTNDEMFQPSMYDLK